MQAHFEHSEFEKKRADGRVKLKPNAVPTIFNVPNPPKRHNPSPRKSLYKVKYLSMDLWSGSLLNSNSLFIDMLTLFPLCSMFHRKKMLSSRHLK